MFIVYFVFTEVIFEVFRRQGSPEKKDDEHKTQKYKAKNQIRTLAVAKLIDGKGNVRYFRVVNAYGEHAEKRLIRQISEELEDQSSEWSKLTIYLNRAPCNVCAGELIGFQKKHNLCITIKAVDAYFLKKDEEKNPSTNLAKLKKLCELSIFNENDWLQLYLCIQQVNFDYPSYMEHREKFQAGRLQERLDMQENHLANERQTKAATKEP